MANQRITKEMAKWAAQDMRNAVYKEKLDNAQAKINEELDKCVKQYFPAPVLACVAEYGEYFRKSKKVSIYVYEKKGKDGEPMGSYQEIYGQVTIDLPIQRIGYGNICIMELLKSECKNITAANDVYRNLYTESIKFKSDIEDALLSLKTEKKITEQLPEALPYLKFPDDKSNLPAPIFSELRTMLQGVTEKKQ